MKHNIRITEAGPHGKAMSDAVTACVHCGFCLPACPTYRELGQEMDSPRGRIYLMKQVLEGQLDAAAAEPHIDRCLGCLACETACPSGVAYHQLISPYRALQSGSTKRAISERLKRWVAVHTLPHPRRFRLAVRSARLVRWLRPVLPETIKPMIDLAPPALPPPDRLPAIIPARGKRRARVALLLGCVQRVLEPGINRATVDVLTRNGVEVVAPPGQGCCGALAWHVGDADMAREAARKMLESIPGDVDAFVVNAAGCGSAMREYGLMFQDQPEEGRAHDLADRTVDVSVFLDRLGFQAPPALAHPLRIAYHDACHLCHGQQVRAEPRRLLQVIDGVDVVELNDGEQCCGSAGTYNLDQPAIAASLGNKKAHAIRATECEMVATGNIGCIVQIRRHLVENGSPTTDVFHTVQVLSMAYAGTLGRGR